MITDRTTLKDLAGDVVSADVDHTQVDLAVVDEQPIARPDIGRQTLVRGGDPVVVARTRGGRDHDVLTGGQTTGPAANHPSLILGPCRSASTPTGRPRSAEI